MRIEKAAVIGASVMGSGIAAHLANCGVDALLLDRIRDGAKGADRSSLAVRAVEALRKSRRMPPRRTPSDRVRARTHA